MIHLAVRAAGAEEAILGAFEDGGDAAERQRSAGGIDAHRYRPEVVHAERLVVDEDGDERAVLVVAPRGDERERGADADRDVLGAEVSGRRAIGIDDHLHLARVAAEHVDATHAVDARQRRANRVLCKLVEDARVGMPAHVEREDGKGHRRDALHADDGVGRQPRLHVGERRLDELERAPHVGTGREEERDLGAAAHGAGAHALDAEHRHEGLLHGTEHRRLHEVGRHVARPHHHADAGKVDLGIDRARERPRREDACEEPGHEHQQDQRAMP
jgi:hypothetical protein